MLEFCNVSLHAYSERLARRTQIRAAGICSSISKRNGLAGVVRIGGDCRRWTTVEITGPSEDLPDQGRSHDLAVALYQAAFSLSGKNHSRKAGDRKRISDTGDQRQSEDEDD